ncbi:MAG: vitamin K epoxide reductase family protein [Phycisphaeraceae bacterium]
MPDEAQPVAVPADAAPRGAHDALLWVIRALALIALAGSAVLLYKSVGEGAAVPGCGPGGGCERVLASRWAYVAEMPVAAAAVGVYALLLAASLYAGPRSPTRRRWVAWLVLAIGAAAAGGAAAWFMGLQIFAIQALCPWCTAVHVAGLGVALLVGYRLLRPRGAVGVPTLMHAGSMAAIGLLLAAAMPLAQAAGPAPAAPPPTVGAGIASDTGPGPDRELMIFWGRIRLLPHTMPVLGSPDADTLIVYLLDYTCGSCRQMHAYVSTARERFGDRLGVVLLPSPLGAECNPAVRRTPPEHRHACELAELALAVWRADPAAFETFDAWLADDTRAGEARRQPAAARARAAELVGEAALEAALAQGWPAAQVRRNTQLYAIAGAGIFPQLLMGEAWLKGLPGSYDAFLAELTELAELE